MSMSIDELGGGSKSWGGEGFGVGDKVSGVITSIKRQQQTGFDDNKPLFWDDGSPRMLTIVEIQTDIREDENDDGIRAIWLKGGNYEAAEGKGKAGEVALRDAVLEAGERTIDEGGKLDVAITGMSKKTSRGAQPAKLWTMRYAAPVASVAADDLFD